MTAQDVTYQRLTVSEAAAVLGVSRMTVRRMIERGQLEAERVHRPQGSAYMVSLPSDGTDQGTPTAQVPRHTGRPKGTDPPAPAEAMVSLIQATIAAVLGPLVAEQAALRQVVERQAEQLVSQAETIGRLSAELVAERAKSSLDASTAAQDVEAAPQSAGRVGALWMRWWPAVAVLLTAGAAATVLWVR